MADNRYNLTPNEGMVLPYVLTPTTSLEFDTSEFTKSGDEKIKRGYWYYININYTALNNASLKIESDGKWLPGTHKFSLTTNAEPLSDELVSDDIKVYITERGLKSLQTKGLKLSGNNITINEVYIVNDGSEMEEGVIWKGFYSTNKPLSIYRYAFDESDEYRKMEVNQLHDVNNPPTFIHTYHETGNVYSDWEEPEFINGTADLADVDFLSLFQEEDDCIVFASNLGNYFSYIKLIKDRIVTRTENKSTIDTVAINIVNTINGIKKGLDDIWGNNEDNYNKYLIITLNSYEKATVTYNTKVSLINILDKWIKTKSLFVTYEHDGQRVIKMTAIADSDSNSDSFTKDEMQIRTDGKLILYLNGRSHQLTMTPNSVNAGGEYIYGSNAYYTTINGVTSTDEIIKSIGNKSEWLKNTTESYLPLKIRYWYETKDKVFTDEEYSKAENKGWCYKLNNDNDFNIVVEENRTMSTRVYNIEYCADNEEGEPNYTIEIHQYPINNLSLQFSFSDITENENYPYPIDFECVTSDDDIVKVLTKDYLNVVDIKLNEYDNNVTMYLTPSEIREDTGQYSDNIFIGEKYLVNFSRTNKIKSIRIQGGDNVVDDVVVDDSDEWPSFNISKKDIYIASVPSLISENNGEFFNSYNGHFQGSGIGTYPPFLNDEVKNLINVNEIILSSVTSRFVFMTDYAFHKYEKIEDIIKDETSEDCYVLINPTKNYIVRNEDKGDDEDENENTEWVQNENIELFSNCLGTMNNFNISATYGNSLIILSYKPLVLGYSHNTDCYGITKSPYHDRLSIDNCGIYNFSCILLNPIKKLDFIDISNILMNVYKITKTNALLPSISDSIDLDFYDASSANFNSKKFSFNIKLTNV